MGQLNLEIEFGMVRFEATMKGAASDGKPIAFKQMHKHADGSMGETGNISYCKVCKADHLTTADYTKGYEYRKGSYVEIPTDEVARLKVKTNSTIIVKDTVSLSWLHSQPLYFTGKSYFLLPNEKAKSPLTAYGLMLEAMDGNCAIGRAAFYGNEHTVALEPTEGGFLMHILRPQGAIHQFQPLVLPANDPKQLALAKMVVESLKNPKPVLDYPNTYAEGVQKLAEDKVAGLPPQLLAEVTAEAPTISMDQLTERLQASLAAIEAKNKETKAEVVEEPKAKAKKTRKGKAA